MFFKYQYNNNFIAKGKAMKKQVSTCGFNLLSLFGKQTEFSTESFESGSKKKWIGVDFDGTLSEYKGYANIKNPGPPVPAMVERVKEWLDNGMVVKIFTARVCSMQSKEDIQKQRKLIEDWCIEHIGQKLEVTNEKDFMMTELWDNRAVGVIENRGIPLRKP